MGTKVGERAGRLVQRDCCKECPFGALRLLSALFEKPVHPSGQICLDHLSLRNWHAISVVRPYFSEAAAMCWLTTELPACLTSENKGARVPV